MAFLPRPVTRMMFGTPEANASSTPYWMVGLSTSGSISFGCAFVAGRNRVPRPAAGNTAFRIGTVIQVGYQCCVLSARCGGRHPGAGDWPLISDDRPSTTMLDPAYVRDNIESVRQRLGARGVDLSAELEQLATLEAARRRAIPQVEGLKREQNAAGDEVARVKRQGLDARPIFEANKQRSQRIKQLEIELDSIEGQRGRLLQTMPNIPHESVPVGNSAADNVVVRTW